MVAIPSSCAGEVERQVVDVTHCSRLHAGALGAELVDRGAGLRIPSSPEMTTPSKSSPKSSWGSGAAPRVRHEGCPMPASWRPAQRWTIGHPGSRREQPVDQAVGVEPERSWRTSRSNSPPAVALLERDQQLARFGVARKRFIASAARCLRRGESREGGEQVGREHSAPVDQQPGAPLRPGAPAARLRRASAPRGLLGLTASSRTPSPNCFR